ncbi:MAG: AAA family ATPase [Thermoleophilaceae bacterium]|nr:AAA family ATPase [Thermoleophilaceae bacterium]
MLLERDAELDELRAVIGATARAQGRLVVVEGPAGAGKSALLEAAAELAQNAGVRTLRARTRAAQGATGSATPPAAPA